MISFYVLFRPSYFVLHHLYNTSSWNCCFCSTPYVARYRHCSRVPGFSEGCQDKGNIYYISTVLDVPDRCFHRHNRSNYPYHGRTLFQPFPLGSYNVFSLLDPMICMCIPGYHNKNLLPNVSASFLPRIFPRVTISKTYHVLHLYIVGLDYVHLASNIRNRKTRQKWLMVSEVREQKICCGCGFFQVF